MTDQADVVIIGAGHNGLVCGAYLAKSGLSVVILEAADRVGGAAATREFSQGFSVSECAHLIYSLHPDIVKDLELEKFGLRYAASNLSTVALSLDGRHIRIRGDSVDGGISTRDAEKYSSWHAQMLKFSTVLAQTFANRPPGLIHNTIKDKLSLLKLGWKVRMLGRHDMQELLRIGGINIYDVLNENFECQLLKGALSLDSVLGSHTGPRSPNTMLAYLYRHVGGTFGFTGPAIAVGGMGAVSEAIASSARSHGAEVRLNSGVTRILTEDSSVVGVRLNGGQEVKTARVISNADPKTTFSALIGYPQLNTEFSRRVSNIRMKGNSAKLHVALNALPEFTGLEENQIGSRLLIAPDADYVERAFNHAKYKEYSQKPIIEINIPTVHDASLAPPGKHLLSAIVQYAPHDLKQGWSEGKEIFKTLVIDLIDRYAPGFKRLIIASELLTPVDIEARLGITAGHWHHGELALDQFFMLRPFPGMSQYAAPMNGLYLCGAGSHPGGNVMGIVGRNCARTVIQDGAGK